MGGWIQSAARSVEPVEGQDDARRVLVRTSILLAAFVVLAVIGVFTVLIPELQDDGRSEETAPQTGGARPTQ